MTSERWTMPWNYDATVYHRCFVSGVHRYARGREPRCGCPCPDCAAWSAEEKYRAAAARIPLSLARFEVVR